MTTDSFKETRENWAKLRKLWSEASDDGKAAIIGDLVLMIVGGASVVTGLLLMFGWPSLLVLVGFYIFRVGLKG